MNVKNEIDFDMVQLVFESNKILGKGVFDIISTNEFKSLNGFGRDIMLEYSNELGTILIYLKH